MFDPATAWVAAKALPWKKILIIVGIIVLITAVATLVKEYGDARYEAGELAEKQTWLDAEQEYLDALQEAESVADANADERVADWNAKVVQERQEIERAKDEGKSIFDVMFR